MSLFMNTFRSDVQELAKKMKDPSIAKEEGYPITLPTSFLPFDFKNGIKVEYDTLDMNYHYSYDALGFNSGIMAMFIGLNGSGKTALAVQMATSIAQRFKNSGVFHVDLERSTSKARVQLLSGWTSGMIHDRYYLNSTFNTPGLLKKVMVDHCQSKILAAANNPSEAMYFTGLYDLNNKPIYEIVPTIWITDSLPMLYEGSTDGDSSNMAAAQSAKAISDLMKTVVPWCKRANVLWFVINHINQKINTNSFIPSQAQNNYLGQSEQLPCGNTPLYLADNVLKVVTSTKLTEEKNPFGLFTGWHSKVKLVKSRSNRAGVEANMIYNQTYGYDRLLSVYNMVKDAGLIRGSGVSYYLEGLPNIKFSQKKFVSKLEENDIMKQCFKQLIQHVGSECLSGNTFNKVDKTEEEMNAEMDMFAAECMREAMFVA